MALRPTPVDGGRTGLLARFARARSGVAAVEFALILPVMLVLYFGMVEVTTALTVQRKLGLLSRTLADVVGRSTNIVNEDLPKIFNAANGMMYPFAGSGVNMTLQSVVVRKKNGTGPIEAVVCWSEKLGDGATATAPGTQLPAPAAGFEEAGQSYIVATVSTVFKPAVGYVLTGEMKLTSESPPWAVRSGREVTRQGVGCLPAGSS